MASCRLKKFKCKPAFGFVLIILLIYFICSRITHLPPHKRSLLCSFGEGRLGNQMSAFATIFSFAEEYKYKHVMLQSQLNMLSHYFQPVVHLDISVLEEDMECENLFGRPAVCRGPWLLPWEQTLFKNDKYIKNYIGIEKSDNRVGKTIDVGPYPNQIKHFYTHLPEIRNIFRFKREYQNHAQVELRKTGESYNNWKLNQEDRSKEIIFVGVHVRRTDYTNHLQSLYKTNQVTESYFMRAMDFFKTRYRNSSVLFIIVSDDIPWTKQTFQNRTDVAFIGNEKVLEKDVTRPFTYSQDIGEDLAILRNCNHTIMSFGTFGLWGAFLAGGDVVAPKQIMEVREGQDLQDAGLLNSKHGWFLL